MDGIKALELEAALTGKLIGGWTVKSLINNGKSAAVFMAEKDGALAALKIFDDELIERYGDKVQLQRIERELTLVGKSHPNMVRILAGGVDVLTKNHYIVMEYLAGPNLKDCLADIADELIPSLIEQLASCCQYLEELNLVHRDIKPENIVLLENYTKLKLLDFGVLLPFGEPRLTDAEGIQSFVGTLQYSSPEFLLRKEEETLDGWRALTFYQIGGILHDLIMRRPLFADQAQPYARLVNAVQQDIPTIQNAAVPTYLVEAARCALVKDPKIRCSLLTWASFRRPRDDVAAFAAAKERVSHRSTLNAAAITSPTESEEAEFLETVISNLKVLVRAVRDGNRTSIPPVNVSREEASLLVTFLPAVSHGLPHGLTLVLKVSILDQRAQAIELWLSANLGDEPAAGATSICSFRGLYNAETLTAMIERCVYCAIDQAQQSEQRSVGQTISLVSLDLGAN